MDSLKRQLIELFKENLRLRQDDLKRTLNWTEESGKGGVMILLFVKLADSLNPRGWSSIRRINCLIKLKGKRDIEELRRICCVEADRARQLKLDEPSVQQKENPTRESAYGSDSGVARQGEFLE